jgi:hypothetical protein
LPNKNIQRKKGIKGNAMSTMTVEKYESSAMTPKPHFDEGRISRALILPALDLVDGQIKRNAFNRRMRALCFVLKNVTTASA